MSEELRRKRNVRAGHHSSATQIMRNIDALLATPGAGEPKQGQLKLSLEEKLQTLKLLDAEILELTGEDDLE